MSLLLIGAVTITAIEPGPSTVAAHTGHFLSFT